MNTVRRHHGLRFKITVGLLLLLVVITTSTSYLRYLTYRELLMQNLAYSVANAAETLEASLLYATHARDPSLTQRVLNNLKKQGLQDLIFLDKEGRVILALEEGRLGDRIEPGSALWQAHQDWRESGHDEKWVVIDSPGERLYRYVKVVGGEATTEQGPLTSEQEAVGLAIVDFTMAHVDAQLRSYCYSRLFLSVASILLVLLSANALMSHLVVGRLKRFLDVVRQFGPGQLEARVIDQSRDEIGELAKAFNDMADSLKEKEALERKVEDRTKKLTMQTDRLSALNALAATVTQSLNLEDVLHSALDEVLKLMKLKAGWIVLGNRHNEGPVPLTSRSLPIKVTLAHMNCAWSRSSCPRVLALKGPKIHSDVLEYPCPVAEYLQSEGLIFRTCVPLQSKDHVLGVMSLFGDASSQGHELGVDALEMLAAIGRQIGIAVENASLYEELRQKETIHRQLLERAITAQEEERKRIARELHDQTSQPLTSLIMTLKVLEESSSPATIRARIEELRETVVQILEGLHDLALQLRPAVLDDLGLIAGLRHCFREYGDNFHLPVDFQVLGLGFERLAPEVETALYRIVQEALSNVARHAQAHNVSVVLDHRGSSVKLIVEDDGQGFDVARVMDSRADKQHLGIYGMRERAALLDGALTIESALGVGTTVFVEIPLREREAEHEQDPPAGGR